MYVYKFAFVSLLLMFMCLVLSLFSSHLQLRLFMKLVFLRNIQSTVHCSTATVVVQLNWFCYCCCFFFFSFVLLLLLDLVVIFIENDVKFVDSRIYFIAADDEMDDELFLKRFFFLCSIFAAVILNENFWLIRQFRFLFVAQDDRFRWREWKICLISIQLKFWVKMTIKTIQMSSKHLLITLSNKSFNITQTVLI